MTDGAEPLGTQPVETRGLARPEVFPFFGRSRELAALRRVLRDTHRKSKKAEVLASELMALMDLPLWLWSQTRTQRLIDAILNLPEGAEHSCQHRAA